MINAATIHFALAVIAFILAMSCLFFLPVKGGMTDIPVSLVKDNSRERIFLIESVDTLSPVLVLLFTVCGLSVLSVFFFVKRIHKLKRETGIITKEQSILVNNLESTITALEDAKEEAYRQQLSMKRIAMVLSHDLQSPFRFLVSSTDTLFNAMLKKDYEDAERISGEIKRSGRHMLRFLTDFTIWIKSISRNYEVRISPVDVYELFDEMESFFSEQLKRRDNTFIYESDGPITILTDKELLKIIIRNIIDNANKNCTKGIIRMKAEKEDKYGKITIEDNGNGIAAEVLNKIKDTIRNAGIYPADPTAENKQGYKFIAHFAGLLHIETHVDSPPNGGTKIILDKLTIA